ncbi:hypothetical protein AB1H94_17735 [Pseudomonas fulva]|uniref:hypothetical protein n=1 Tax=Pseudomonas fulva TaxID=47880 RepID=UPI00345CED68
MNFSEIALMTRNDLLIWAGCALLFFAGAIWGAAWPKSAFFSVSSFHDLTEIFAAVATVFAVVFGVSAWKNQLRGHSDHDLSRRVLVEAEKLKIQTMIITKSTSSCIDSHCVHMIDWGRLQEIKNSLRSSLQASEAARASMSALLIETDVVWGMELRSKYHDLLELNQLCCYYVRDFLEFMEDSESAGAEDLSYVERKLVSGGWQLSEPERIVKMNELTSSASSYLKAKLVS